MRGGLLLGYCSGFLQKIILGADDSNQHRLVRADCGIAQDLCSSPLQLQVGLVYRSSGAGLGDQIEMTSAVTYCKDCYSR